MAQQDEVETICQRLAALAAEIRGLRDSGLPPWDEAQKTIQLHLEIVALNRTLLRADSLNRMQTLPLMSR